MANVLKAVLIGTSGSGKSVLINRLVKRTYDIPFQEVPDPTIGVAFHQLRFDNDVRLQVWDTAGQERYAPLVPMYARDADLIICHIDFSKPYEVAAIEQKINHAKSDARKDVNVMIVGTKSDLKNASDLPSKITLNNVTYDVIHTSAKTGAGIDKLFTTLQDFSKQKFPQDQSEQYLEVRKRLVASFKTLADDQQINLEHKLLDLEAKIRDPKNASENKFLELSKFTSHCEFALKKHPSSLKIALELIALIALPILVGVIGFGIGFTLGLWSGPGAFISGLAAGHAAAVAVTAATGGSALISGGLGFVLFKPAATPAIVNEFDAVAREEIKLKPAAPAA